MKKYNVNTDNTALPTVVVALLEGLCIRYIVSPEIAFSVTGVRLADLKQGFEKFSTEQCEQVLDILIEESGVDHMGLCLGQSLQIESLGLFGPLIASCSTPRQAIATFSQFKRLLHSTLDIQLKEDAEYSVIQYASNDGVPIGEKPYYAEAMMAALVTLGGCFLGSPVKPIKVTFRHSEPNYHAIYNDLFRCPVYFDQPHDGIYCENALLDQPMLSASEAYNQDLLAQGTQVLAQFDGSLVQLITDMLKQNIHIPNFGLQQIAERLYISPRTLQRGLKRHNTRFGDLKNQVRFRYAKALLAKDTMTITQIAERLGYQDRSNFVHAFKRWSGSSPSQYQKSID